jgi:hypothetical protein
MKFDEVPQDEAFLQEGRIRDLCYVVDKDGHYTSVLSKGWTPKNDALKLAWNQIYNHAEETRLMVLDGKLSPIALYMELNIMDLTILANYMELPKWKVRRHLKMKGFKNLNTEMLLKYAEALNITATDLVDIERIKGIVIAHED